MLIFIVTQKELVELLHDFEILSLRQQKQQKPGSYHWHYVAGWLKHRKLCNRNIMERSFNFNRSVLHCRYYRGNGEGR